MLRVSVFSTARNRRNHTDDAIQRGRDAAASRLWAAAYDLLTAADQTDPLGADDLEELAFAAYMIGRDDEMAAYLERAHRLHLESAEELRAARSAIWIGMNYALKGQAGPASGWFGRAERIVERHGEACVEAGYLKVPVIIQLSMSGQHEAASHVALEAIQIGEQFADADLIALAVHGRGRSFVRLGRIDEGLRLLDEAMVAVTADRLLPIVSGIIYCSVIEVCYEVQELRRAHSWTESLSGWCGGQPDLVAFSGQCLTHRAELLQLRGDWEAALTEAQRAGDRFLAEMNQYPAAQAHYRQGELYRLRGDLAEAEAAYRRASQWGWAPQPGLALLRLAQGEGAAAARALRTQLDETPEAIDRARLLPALIEVALDIDDLNLAIESSDELSEIAAVFESTMIAAAALLSRGMVLLAVDKPTEAMEVLAMARTAWREFDAPYEMARVRSLLGLAYAALGDDDSAALELDAARSLFGELGARPDLDRIGQPHGADASILTERESEVLELVAAGKTNREIADDLFVSHRTVDRHVSNILTKLGVTSRTAAASYALEHNLI